MQDQFILLNFIQFSSLFLAIVFFLNRIQKNDQVEC